MNRHTTEPIARTKQVYRQWKPGIRVQLTLLYTAVFALLILLAGFILYTTLQADLTAGLDSTLQLRAQQIASGISIENGSISIQDVTGELPALNAPPPPDGSMGGTTPAPSNQSVGSNDNVQQGAQSDVTIGTLVRVLTAQSHVTYISPAFHALNVPNSSITQSLHGAVWQGTVYANNGQAVRLYSLPLTDNGKVYGILQVGEPLSQLDATLSSIVLALLLIGPFVLLLSALGSYWLAKRAFRPILHLTRTAREINAGDLQRRVPIPQAKDEVYDLALTLNDMIGRLDQAFTQQRRFVADASHELRTPITVIRSITDIALESTLTTEEYVSVLRDVNAETERLGQLINDLLALARADEGHLSFDYEPVRLDLLALDVAAAMEPLAVERGISLAAQATEATIVSGDTARLIQMMMGLVDNALTYTNADGAVRLTVTHDNVHASFSVHDTGIGIAEEDADHVFERFYRADPARSRAVGGSGLGLSIVDWIVRAHRGSIAVESHIEQGSTFTVTLPLAPMAIPPTSENQMRPLQSQDAETRPLHR